MSPATPRRGRAGATPLPLAGDPAPSEALSLLGAPLYLLSFRSLSPKCSEAKGCLQDSGAQHNTWSPYNLVSKSKGRWRQACSRRTSGAARRVLLPYMHRCE
ncbi:Hypothetical predicted protein [Podarcis lilfordi]|uniref:Uncharacterized protein n=1 Tax=Podarcis lilfordi TaxID=74358 RepID=A0AA35JMX4_9SAUR|nr:Hypothetical predicted protein [Podarcis lilfordi]